MMRSNAHVPSISSLSELVFLVVAVLIGVMLTLLSLRDDGGVFVGAAEPVGLAVLLVDRVVALATGLSLVWLASAYNVVGLVVEVLVSRASVVEGDVGESGRLHALFSVGGQVLLGQSVVLDGRGSGSDDVLALSLVEVLLVNDVFFLTAAASVFVAFVLLLVVSGRSGHSSAGDNLLVSVGGSGG